MRRIAIALSLPLLAASNARDVFDDLARDSLARIHGRLALPGLRDSVEIIRDRWGVPHVYARNLDDLFFAQGFTQA